MHVSAQLVPQIVGNCAVFAFNCCWFLIFLIFLSLIFNFIYFFFVAVLLCMLSKPAMNEIFLVLVSYVILGTFLAIEIAVSYAVQPRFVRELSAESLSLLTAVAWQQELIMPSAAAR